ncbi:MAG: M3 family oligoendopeptidase [Candidatus Micrarchaeota archaeon]|nr:M3 family oligoendopeptidase [Candidatus Micrarchaeota archaeon]MDE1804411.1 M3 family oligoendopeptidase [Candidatus Micrarchaeota archaeon]MDE1846921.1 M3 family oligoendopeptidase [Candidatus Micrarchaeota archaeon]
MKGEWNLKELVTDKKDLETKIKKLDSLTKKFEQSKKSLKNTISSGQFNSALKTLEQLNEVDSILGSYASLRFSEDTQSDENSALMTRITRLDTAISNRMTFFFNWWKKEVDDKNARRLIKDAGELSYYMDYSRRTAKYMLSEPEEKIINTMSSTGISSLIKLYGKITNAFEYNLKIGGRSRSFTREELAAFVRGPDMRMREAAYRALQGKYSTNLGVIGDIYQSRVLYWHDNFIDMRGYKSPISARNIMNDLSDDSVSVLLDVCRENSGVFREFFKIKAKVIGVRRLRRYDLYAPVAEKSSRADYTYGKAESMIIGAWEKVNPQLASYAKRIFDQGHIDYSIRKGKKSGAFCNGVTPQITPYVQVNYNGKLDSVFTLAHELGHAMHNCAAAKHSIMNMDAPLPIAETASTFSETVLAEDIIPKMQKDALRGLLFKRMDDFYATIGRQSYFTLFEIAAHEKISAGAMSSDINKVYYANLSEQFGNAIDLSRDFEVEWSSIPHFFNTPFYCYAYSFGNLLALALYQRYREEGGKFAKEYQDILAAGGSQNPQKMLAEHDIDISSPKLWRDGFDYIKGQVALLRKSV